MISRLLKLALVIAMCICAYSLYQMSQGSSCGGVADVSLGAGTGAGSRVEVYESESKKFAADKFVASFSLEMRGKDKDALFKQLADRRSAIFAQVASLEISESNVEQNSVNMHKEWDYYNGQRKLAGYTASQSFLVTTNNRNEAAALVTLLSSEPDVEIGRTQAMLKDESSLEKQVIDAVGKKALAKAENYAKSVGAKLGKVVYVNGEGGGVSYGSFAGMHRSKAMMMNAVDGAMGASQEAIADSAEISAGIRLIVELK